MKKICGLENWQFMTQMSASGDTWNLSGNAFGHPNFRNGQYIQIGQIIRFDEANMIIETNRRIYQLGFMSSSAFGGRDKQIAFIKEEIAKLV